MKIEEVTMAIAKDEHAYWSAIQPDLFSEPPAQRHSPTSVAAAEQIKPTRKSLAQSVYLFILNCGPVTDEQIASALDMNPSTARPRRVELVRAGRIESVGPPRRHRGVGRRAGRPPAPPRARSEGVHARVRAGYARPAPSERAARIRPRVIFQQVQPPCTGAWHVGVG